MSKATKLLVILLSVGVASAACFQVRANDTEGENCFGEQTALYVWSDALQSRSVNSVLELAQAHDIERLILSVGRGVPVEKVDTLKARGRQNDITTEFLLAPNYWVRSGDLEDVRSRVRGIDLRGSPLHLNIEPHAYDDFDQREEEYLRRYLEVLRETRKIIGDGRLTVSVPLFWPDSTYREIAPIVDRVYLMAYGEKRPAERAEQTREVARHFAPAQRVVALRPEDYSGPSALNQSIPVLGDGVGTGQFALHDLESFVGFVGYGSHHPVELANFHGTATETNARLTWETDSETNNAGFEVQHKRAGGPWQPAGYVESKAECGTSTEGKPYEYAMNNLPVGTHTFRLKQIDLYGNTTLTDTVSVSIEMQRAVLLTPPAPNPASSSATFSFAIKEQTEARITLHNTLGQRLVTVYDGTPQAGEQQTAQIDVSGLPSGAYFLRLKAGDQARTRRLTVVR